MNMNISKRGFKLGFLALLLIGALFITGCQQKVTEPKMEGPYIGGVTGLEFAFQENEPPQAVLDDSQEQFYFTLVVRNLGEYTVEVGKAIASLSGVDANAFGMNSLDTKNEVEITGTSPDNGFVISGAEELLEFEEASYINDVATTFDVPIRADLCYGYHTEALTAPCLKKNVVRESIGDVCATSNPELQLSNSGAPIQVTGMRQKAVGSNKVQLSFAVENVGQGLVYLPDSFTDSCRGNEDNKDMVKVTLRNPQENFVVECTALGKSNTGNIRLVNGRKELTCTINTENLQDVSYQDILFVDVDYMYREAITTSLRVENAI